MRLGRAETLETLITQMAGPCAQEITYYMCNSVYSVQHFLQSPHNLMTALKGSSLPAETQRGSVTCPNPHSYDLAANSVCLDPGQGLFSGPLLQIPTSYHLPPPKPGPAFPKPSPDTPPPHPAHFAARGGFVRSTEFPVPLRKGSWYPLQGDCVGMNKITQRKPSPRGPAHGALLVGLVCLTSCPPGSQAQERRRYN